MTCGRIWRQAHVHHRLRLRHTGTNGRLMVVHPTWSHHGMHPWMAPWTHHVGVRVVLVDVLVTSTHLHLAHAVRMANAHHPRVHVPIGNHPAHLHHPMWRLTRHVHSHGSCCYPVVWLHVRRHPRAAVDDVVRATDDPAPTHV